MFRTESDLDTSILGLFRGQNLISRGRENTGDYFPSLHGDWGAAGVNMARKIFKPIFWRLREIRVLSQKDYLAHRRLCRKAKALCLCIANACKHSAGTGSWWRSPKWCHRYFFHLRSSTCRLPRWIDRRFLSELSPVQVCSAPKFFLLHFFSLSNLGLQIQSLSGVK